MSFDEITVGFNGKIKFKVYYKDKPTKWGLKIIVLSDARNSYLHMVIILPYYGQATTDMLPTPELLVTSTTVLHVADKLAEAYPGGAFIFYIGRFYYGMELARELQKLNIHLTGTIL